MCGIAGTFGFSDIGLTKSMCNKMRYRGPDETGFYSDDKICLGNVRLKIIDLETGKQPMSNEDGSIVVVFNGEIYNFKELRKGLEKNHTFKTKSDTEVIVHLYENLGPSFVKKLDGPFAIALWDSNQKKLILARDRLGIKPLYYFQDGDRLVFASEIKSILEYNGIKGELDCGAIEMLLTFRFVPGERTAIKGVRRLLPGTMMVCGRKMESKTYWKLGLDSCSLSESEITHKTHSILKESVEKRLMSDVPLGTFLSGGLDSSMITAYANNLVDGLKTFTVGFGESGDEFEFARSVADHLGTQHHEIVVRESQIERRFEEIIYLMDEPVMDPAMVPTFFLSKGAKKQVTVALLGEGADELFAGYQGYRIVPPFVPIPKLLGGRAFFNVSSTFPRSEVKNLLGGLREKPFEVFRPYTKAKTDTLNSICMFDISEVLPNYQLLRVDRMTMASAVEGRVPFLDTKLAEFSMTLSGRTKMNLKGGKVVLRKLAKDILPKEVYTSKKRTFFTPVKSWLEGPMSEALSRTVENPNIFSRRKLENLSGSAKSFKDFHKLWILVTTELWYNKFIGDRS